MKTILAILAALALSACAGSVPSPYDADWNPQAYAGITAVEAHWKEDGSGLDRVTVFQGKEGESFDVAVDLNAGTMTWQGKGVRAFDGQAVRAAVEQAISEDVKEAFPGIVETVVRAITGL